MAQVFRTAIDVNKYIESACEKAIKAVAERMTEELQGYIQEDFYNQYKPKFYKRSEQLLRSPKYNILDPKSAEIFIDIDSIDYLIGSNEKYDYDEADIVKLASLGYHGTIDIFRPGMFWEDFIVWCNKNVPYLIKSELKRQGISVK